MEIIGHGAEGRVFSIDDFYGRPAIVKERAKKAYRVPELDVKLTKSRLVQESRCIMKARRSGVATPCLYQVDLSKGWIIMERVIGSTVKEVVKEYGVCERTLNLAALIGETVAKLHDADIVHGDLTTSNMMTRVNERGESQNDLVLIDFGLAFSRPSIEDKAVDLYVLERAFESTHPNTEDLVRRIIEKYRQTCRKQGLVLQKLGEVRQRGRKRDMCG
jgi:TP53 regulating kinase and related kinases